MVNLHRKNQSGMTLLEVLVATSILAVIASLAFVSLDNLAGSKQTLDAKTKQLNQANLAQYILQTDLQMAVGSVAPLPSNTPNEFVGSSQGFSLVRYRNALVQSGRSSKRQTSQYTRGSQLQDQPMIRVRWYMRNNQWFRATQSAFSPVNSNQWSERPMMTLKSLNCSYQNVAGLIQPSWPNSPIEQGKLPELISCQIHSDEDLKSVIKVVPWQKMGFL